MDSIVDINGSPYWVVENLDKMAIDADVRNVWKVMSKSGEPFLLMQFRSGKAYTGVLIRDEDPQCMMVEWRSLFKDFVH